MLDRGTETEREFQDSQDYTERSCLQKPKSKPKQKQKKEAGEMAPCLRAFIALPEDTSEDPNVGGPAPSSWG
jgi:hypothetical protein